MKNLFTILIILATFAGFSATIYIDPTNTATGQNGSIDNPYDSWQDFTIQAGFTYLQKVETVYSSSVQIYVNVKNVTIATYGKSTRYYNLISRAKFNYTGSGYAIRVEADNCFIDNFEIDGNKNAWALIGLIGTASKYCQNNTVNNCLLYNAHNTNNAGFGIYGLYNKDLKILNTEIKNVALDGIYFANIPGIEIGICKISDINRRYFVNSDQKYSSGDGIQLDGNYNGFWVHHTTIDRTNGAGNKFNMILNSAPGTSDNATGIIEYCTFVNDNTVTCALHIERGNGIKVRQSHFLGSTLAIRIGGAYSNNIEVYNNLFINCDRGVGIGATYPGGYPATGTEVTNNEFIDIKTYHIWVDRSTVEVSGNIHNGKPGSVQQYNYGGGKFIEK